MPGPSLTPLEVAAVLHGAVERFVRLGVGRDDAIRAVALDNGIEPAKVEQAIALVAPVFASKEVL